MFFIGQIKSELPGYLKPLGFIKHRIENATLEKFLDHECINDVYYIHLPAQYLFVPHLYLSILFHTKTTKGSGIFKFRYRIFLNLGTKHYQNTT